MNRDAQAFFATRLIGMMISSSREDLAQGDDHQREVASSWFESQDNALTSFNTGCSHLAGVSASLSMEDLEKVARALNNHVAADRLQHADGWREVVLQLSVEQLPRQIFENAVDTISMKAFPEMVPQLLDQDADLSSWELTSPEHGPGR